jgi:hypothetical protein
MQVFFKGDVLQFRDKSQWEIIEVFDEPILSQILYSYRNLDTKEEDLETEAELNKKAIVIKWADPIPEVERPKAKIYYLADYRKRA